MSEASRKRRAALEAAGPFQTSDPADVRWLLRGRGRPVATGPSPYAVVVERGGAAGPLPGHRGAKAFAVAWNLSVTGGGKSEDTALVSADGVEVETATPDLQQLDSGRPGIVRL